MTTSENRRKAAEVFCPNCGFGMFVGWEMIDDDSVWSVKYDHKRKCPYCGAELEISHVLVPHFTAEFAR